MNGDFIRSYGSFGSNDGQFNYPTGICISPPGQTIVSEANSDIYDQQHRVQIFE
jgi:hypothetical protein